MVPLFPVTYRTLFDACLQKYVSVECRYEVVVTGESFEGRFLDVDILDTARAPQPSFVEQSL